jgi:hypothetical protein
MRFIIHLAAFAAIALTGQTALAQPFTRSIAVGEGTAIQSLTGSDVSRSQLLRSPAAATFRLSYLRRHPAAAFSRTRSALA